LEIQIVDEIDVDVTHVIVDRKDPHRFPQLAQQMIDLRRHPNYHLEKRVVDLSWVVACCEKGALPLVEPTDGYTVDVWSSLREEEEEEEAGGV